MYVIRGTTVVTATVPSVRPGTNVPAALTTNSAVPTNIHRPGLLVVRRVLIKVPATIPRPGLTIVLSVMPINFGTAAAVRRVPPKGPGTILRLALPIVPSVMPTNTGTVVVAKVVVATPVPRPDPTGQGLVPVMRGTTAVTATVPSVRPGTNVPAAPTTKHAAAAHIPPPVLTAAALVRRVPIPTPTAPGVKRAVQVITAAAGTRTKRVRRVRIPAPLTQPDLLPVRPAARGRFLHPGPAYAARVKTVRTLQRIIHNV